MFFTETHCHTSPASPCSLLSPKELVQGYHQAGYHTLVLTNHFTSNLPEGGSPLLGVERYLFDYELAKAAAMPLNMTVLLGAELKFRDEPEDFLLYGITPQFLLEHPNLYDYTPKELFDLCEQEGILIYQAHPFRPELKPQEPRLLHGVEVYNGHEGHDSKNHLALAFAEKHNLLQISGSDCHYSFAVGTGGIQTQTPIKTNEDLLTALKQKDLSLLRNQK